MLFAGYSQGLFPMADDDGIEWYDVDPRAIIPLDAFHVPQRLARTVRSGKFTVTTDVCFRQVMEACAAPHPGRETTWISEEMVDAYCEFHQMHLAHSIEVWRDGALAGGLYGVAIGGLFAGESIFTIERDAGKVALVHLVERLRRAGFVLLDTQFIVGPHMRQFGAIEISRAEYRRRLAAALRVDARWDGYA
jgi:leucyl/phenylalanyl-tRNA--protein transferase